MENKAALDKLPEAQRGLYVERDGKFHLDVELPDDDGKAARQALERERSARRGIEKQLKELKNRFEGVDPEQFKKFMAHFDDEEDAELLKQGPAGIDKLVEKRMAKEREGYEEKIAELQEQVDGGLEVAGTFMDRVLASHVVSAAAKAGVHPSAMDDVVLRAQSIFSVDDDGNAVQFETEGEEGEERVVMGRDGKTPYSPAEWVEDMKEKAPHWFPANSSGGGAGGSRGGQGGGAKTIPRTKWETMSLQERAAKSKEGYIPVDA